MKRSPAFVAACVTVGMIVALRKALNADVRRRPADRVRALEPPQPVDLSGAPEGLARAPLSAQDVVGGARFAPPAWEPQALTAVARWEPLAPATRAARLVAYLWAAPLTVVGLLLGALTGQPPRVRDGVVLFAPAGGLPGRVIASRRFSAASIGHVIIAIDEPSDALWAHELVHVRHAERLGPALPVAYGVLLALYGYARHPLERAARRAQRRVLGAPG